LYPLLIKWGIDHFQSAGRDFHLLLLLAGGIIVVSAFKGGTLYMQSILTNRIASLTLSDLQNAVFLSVNRADALQIAGEAPASLAQRFYVEMIYIQTAVTRMLTS